MAGRERLIMSKNHCSETVYAAVAEAGFFSKELFSNHSRIRAQLRALVEIIPLGDVKLKRHSP